MARTITEENLGAWLIKCNPETYDLLEMVDRGIPLDSWSVAPGYRSEMMAAGDKVLLWVSGNGRVMSRGIWGAGRVTGPVEAWAIDADDLWLDDEARAATSLFAQLNVALFSEAVPAEELLGEGLGDLEVLRVPNGQNPSWVSKEQFARLEPLLKPHLDSDTAEVAELPDDTPATIDGSGAGFGTAESNAEVEAAAMAAVVDYYEGWDWQDDSAAKVGWDITFTHPESDEVALVEVKGVSGTQPSVFLTRNELRAAKENTNWYLAVVTSALSDPLVSEHGSAEVLAASEPYMYRLTLERES